MISEPPDRAKSRRWGAVVACIWFGVLGLVVYSHLSGGDRSEEQIAQGIEQLHKAIVTSDDDSFAAATRHFARATPTGFVDRYPAFLMHATEAIADLSGDEIADRTSSSRQRYFQALAHKDWKRAAESLRQLQNQEERRYMRRLLEGLQTVHAQESASSDGTS